MSKDLLWFDVAIIALVIMLAVGLVLLVLLLLRRPPDIRADIREGVKADMRAEFSSVMAQQGRADRQELTQAIGEGSKGISHQMASIASVQNNQIDSFAQQLAKLIEVNDSKHDALRQSLLEQAHRSRESLDKALGEVRNTLESKIKDLQTENAAKLEEMRRTVDEKLHATLEQRLGESFKQVSDRLEQVHRGLGEMHALASDVGDLKRVLTNVKTRGAWGEIQLEAILEQLLIQEQYERNVEIVPRSGERVEFAIRLPGKGRSGASYGGGKGDEQGQENGAGANAIHYDNGSDKPCWLPIDAKFPREDYERLLQAFEQADATAAEIAGKQLENTVKEEAKKIRSKYISPPLSTDFALMFLPVEGLYAEVVRRPGLLDTMQREYRVVVAGPTTLAAILSSLQMGFRTLAVEKRSSEVWELLGAVKTEFGKFGDVLAKTKDQLEKAANTIGSAETRTRAIERKLRGVETLPESQSRKLLPEMTEPDEG